MNKSQQRQVERLRRVAGFGARHQHEFAAASRGTALFISLIDLLNEIETEFPSFRGENSRRGFNPEKQKAWEAMQEEMEFISRTATLVVGDDPELAGKFSLPDKRKKNEVVAAARQFLQAAEPLRDEFVSYEMSPTFLEDLNELLATIEAPSVDPEVMLKDALIRGNGILRSLDVIVGNKYSGQNDVLKLWAETIK